MDFWIQEVPINYLEGLESAESKYCLCFSQPAQGNLDNPEFVFPDFRGLKIKISILAIRNTRFGFYRQKALIKIKSF